MHNIAEQIVIFIAICTSIAADLYIAVSLCLVLHGARTGFRSTGSMLSTLIMYTISRGILTFLVHSLTVATLVYCVRRNSVIAMIFYLPVGSSKCSLFTCCNRACRFWQRLLVYANSLLAALNIRKRVSEAGAAAHNSVVVPDINTDHLGLQNHQESDELHGLPDSQPTADIELADNAESAAQWRLAWFEWW